MRDKSHHVGISICADLMKTLITFLEPLKTFLRRCNKQPVFLRCEIVGSSCKSVGKLMSFKQYSTASNKEKRAFKGIKKSV